MIEEKDILITGTAGLVGSELAKLMPNAIGVDYSDFDLTCENEVKYLFFKHKPKCIIHLAAKVGGILDNYKNQATYFDDNILMNTLLVKYAYLNKVERFIGVLSSCIYPDVVEQYPIEHLSEMHSGPPPETNFSYGYAKRSLAVQIDSYNKQFGTLYNYVMPCNMYGENDKLDPQKSHFIAALITKIIEAVKNNKDHITLMGDGTPLRQFMYAKDLAVILKYMVDNDIYSNLNIAPEKSFSIDELAKIALNVTGNSNLKIIYDTTKPNGQYRKDISSKKLLQIIPNYKFTSLEEGIKNMYDYLLNK